MRAGRRECEGSCDYTAQYMVLEVSGIFDVWEAQHS